MGTYICEAFNGVPKNATQEFQIHVYCEFDLEKSHFYYPITVMANFLVNYKNVWFLFAVSPTILVGEQVVGGYQVKTNVENAYKQEILL